MAEADTYLIAHTYLDLFISLRGDTLLANSEMSSFPNHPGQ